MGWGCISNDFVRVHLPLTTIQSSYIKVSGESRLHVKGECVAFDDSLLHGGRNEGEVMRIILIVDFFRVEGMRSGEAEGDATQVEGWREEFIRGEK